LYCSTNIIRKIKSRKRRRWAGYVERVGEKRNPYRDLFEKLVRDRFKVPVLADMIMLKWIFKTKDGRTLIVFG
jgi:hypothetical protein